MTVIGITGGTGAGKTTLLNELKKRGAFVIDCDELYHNMLENDEEMKSELVSRFGQVFTGASIDRKALGRIVFSDERALKDLNDITHKYVRRRVAEMLDNWKSRGGTLAAVDAIALIESGLSEYCGCTVAVTAPLQLRAERIVAREGISPEYAMMRIKSQKPDSFFESACDYVLMNDCDTADEFRIKCNMLLDKITGGFNDV